MKSKIEKIIYFIIATISSIIFADYNTYFIETTHLRIRERGVIFILFLIMGLSISYYIIGKKQLYKKIIKGEISKYIVILSIVLSFVVIKTFEKDLIILSPQKIDLTITALNEKSDESMGNEVWITGIRNGNTNINLSEVSLTEGWSMNQESLLSAANKPAAINILLYSDKAINIDFVKHNYSGKVKIIQNQQETIIDLYDSNGSSYTYKAEPNNNIKYYGLRIAEISYILIILILILLLHIFKKLNMQYKENLLQVGKVLSYNKYMYIIVLVLATITSSIYYMPNSWNSEKREVVLEVLGEKNQDSLSYDVWIQSVDIDGNDIDLEKYKNETWLYQEDGKLVGTSNKENALIIEVNPRQEIGINLKKGVYGGKVSITCNGETNVYDLYNSTNSVERVIYRSQEVATKNYYRDIIMLAISIIIYTTVYLMFLDKDKRNKVFITSVILSNLVSYGIVAAYRIIDIWQIIFINILSIFIINYIMLYFYKRKESIDSEVIWKPIYQIYNFIFIIFVLISFKFNIDLPNLTFIGKAILIIEMLIAGMIICREIEIIFLSKKFDYVEYANKEKKQLIIRGIIPISVISLIYFIGCYPGFMTSDSIDQWGQILTGYYKDAHPVFHTLFNQICTLIWKSPAAISLAQSGLFISICTYAIIVLMDCKLPRKIIYLAIGIFILSPVYHLMNMTIWKDVMYSNMILLYTLYIIKIVTTDFEWLSNNKNLVMFVLVNLGTLLFRHNGVSVVVATAVFSIIFFRKKWVKITIAYTIIGSIFIIIIVPIYNTIGMESYLLSEMSTEKLPYNKINYHNISYIILKNGDITTEEIEEIKKIRDIDEMIGEYSKYDTSNVKVDESVVNEEYLKDNSEAYKKLYNNIVSRNKRLILKNRLNLKSYLWQAMQPVDGYLNLSPVNIIYENEYGLEFKPISNRINSLITAYFKVSENREILSLVWRPMTQLLFIILAAIVIVQKRTIKESLIIVPVLGNWASLLISINFQDFRYMYCVMLIFPIVLAMMFIENKNICKK